MILGSTRLIGHEYSVLSKKIVGDKQYAGRVVKVTNNGNIAKVTLETDTPYGIVIGNAGTFGKELGDNQSIVIRGREVYVELDPTVTSIVAGSNAYINAEGQFSTSDAGSYVGQFVSQEILTSGSSKVALVRVG